MKKQRIEYDSPVDAIVAIARRLSLYEERHGMSFETFLDKFSKGQMEDSLDSVEWASDYQHYLALKPDVENLRGPC